MTASAESVDWLVEHKRVVCGMGRMTGDAAHSKNNAMDIGHWIFFVKQLLFITMTGDTNMEGTLSPEQILVLTPMGIMAQSTSANHCTMLIFAGLPFFFSGMTGETGRIDSALAETDAPGLNVLQVTGKALFINRGAVLPGSLGNNVFVAFGTGCLFLNANGVYGFVHLQFMAVNTTLRQSVILVKLVKTFHIQGKEPLQGTICKLQLLSVGNDGKIIQSILERQPEVQVNMPVTFHADDRFKYLTGVFHANPSGLTGFGLAQDKMGFRIPGKHLGPWKGGQQFHICSEKLVHGCNDFYTEENTQQQKKNCKPACLW